MYQWGKTQGLHISRVFGSRIAIVSSVFLFVFSGCWYYLIGFQSLQISKSFEREEISNPVLQ